MANVNSLLSSAVPLQKPTKFTSLLPKRQELSKLLSMVLNRRVSDEDINSILERVNVSPTTIPRPSDTSPLINVPAKETSLGQFIDQPPINIPSPPDLSPLINVPASETGLGEAVSQPPINIPVQDTELGKLIGQPLEVSGGEGAEQKPVDIVLENSTFKRETGQRRKFFGITSGGKRVGDLIIRIDRDGTAFVDDIITPQGPGSLGPTAIRSIMEKFLSDNPGVKTIKGFRTSGGREKFGGKPTIDINAESVRQKATERRIQKEAHQETEVLFQRFLEKFPDSSEEEARKLFF